MTRLKVTSRDMLKTLKKIQRTGRSDKTILIFLSELCNGLSANMYTWTNHCLAVAEVMSRLAPKGQADTWYLVGLLYRVSDIWSAAQSYHTRSAFTALMRKAGFSSGSVFCIENYDRIDEPGAWSPMMASLIYADAHVTDKGDVLTSARCCYEHDKNGTRSKEDCTACMYAKYYFSCRNDLERCEQVLAEVRKDLTEAEKNRNTKESKEVYS